MDSTRFQLVRTLYHSILSTKSEEREALLERECASDPELRREVESLLRSAEEAGEFLEPTANLGELASMFGHEVGGMPERIGAYEIRGLIGAGGMGLVYEAIQENPRRPVALKILRGPLTKSMAKRLELEAEALGKLRHPGIAQVYEAGTWKTDQGPQPFFAMELVEGLALLDYVEQRELDTRAKLELVCQVCLAVQHAHQSGVIHCDLKPGNLLVTTTGMVKVLDFGISRLVDREGPSSAAERSMERFAGTVGYMSPEQLSEGSSEIDSRSDVYALGVICFELLSGGLPHEVAGQPHLEAARIIREGDAASLSKEHGRDLVAIVAKAMAKDRDQRYSSCAQFADDLGRFLRSEPVSARTPTTLYQIQKLLGRYKLASAIALVLVLFVGATAVFATWQALRFANQRDLARAAQLDEERARLTAEALVEFLEDMFRGADPGAQAEQFEPRDLLAAARESLDEQLLDQPLARARLMSVMGNVSRTLGDYDGARKLLEESLEIRTRELSHHHPDLLFNLTSLARLQSALGEHELAHVTHEDVLRRTIESFGEVHEEALEARSQLGSSYFYAAKYEEAEREFRVALELALALFDEFHTRVASCQSSLAATLSHLGEHDEAMALLDLALAGKRATPGDPGQILRTLGNLGHALHAKRDFAASQRAFREQVELARKTRHELHPDLASALSDYAYLVRRTDRDAAVPLYREAVAILRVIEPGHPQLAKALNDLGTLQLNRGEHEEGVALLEESVDISLEQYGGDDPRTANNLNSLAKAYQVTRNFEKAVGLLRQVLDTWRTSYGAVDSRVAVAHMNLGATFTAQGERKLAEAEYVAGQAICDELDGPNAASFRRLRSMLRYFGGDFEGGESLAREALQLYEDKWPSRTRAIALARQSLGANLLELGRLAEAEPLLVAALEFHRSQGGGADAIFPLINLSSLKSLQGEHQPALQLATEALDIAQEELLADHPGLARATARVGSCKEAERAGDADSVLREALDLLQASPAIGEWEVARTRLGLAKCLSRLGGGEEALENGAGVDR